MRLFSAAVCVMLAAVLASADLHAQGGGLFLPAETPGAADPAPGVTVLRSRVVRIDFGALTAARLDADRETPAPPLTLNLFDDVMFSGIVERTAPTFSGGYVLSGRLDGIALGTMTLVVNGEVVAGTVLTPQATYRIRSAGGRLHAIRQIDPATLPPEGEPLIPPPPAAGAPDAPDPTAPVASDDDGSVIDMAVFYTPAARQKEGGSAAIEALIDLMIAETNQAYADSGVIQRVRLVSRDAVDYTEAASGFDDLYALTYRDGVMDEIHAIRDRDGADLVHLIVDRDRGGVFDACGIAWIMIDVSNSFQDHGFAFTDYRCEGRTLAHELGHNMGLRHDRYVEEVRGTPGLTSYPYSFGYVNQRAFEPGAPASSRWRTIMAYDDQCRDSNFHCERPLRFSNPDQTYDGDRLGVPGDQVSASVTGPSDARRALNNTRTTVANFRPTRFTECQYTLSPPHTDVRATGGEPFELTVATNSPLCAWTARSTVGFLQVTGQARGTGDGTVRYRVLENTDTATRVGAIMVGNETATVTQFGCPLTLAPPHHYVLGTGGGPFEFAVATDSPRCSWTASSTVGFLQLTGQASGTGDGTVRYHVLEHPGSATRVGAIMVGNETATVTQFAGLNPPRTVTSAATGADDVGAAATAGTTDPDPTRSAPRRTETGTQPARDPGAPSALAASPDRGRLVPIAASAAADPAGLRAWDTWVDALAGSDALVLQARRADRRVRDRMHESFAQYHRGVPVQGGGVSRQRAHGETVSIFGAVHQAIDIDPVPGLSAAQAAARLQTATGAAPVLDRLPTLVIFPMPTGSYALTWRATLTNARTYFVNAHSGEIAFEIPDLQAQSAVGTGFGIHGDRKKVSAIRAGGVFQARDQLRPGETLTLDLRHDAQRLEYLLAAAPAGPRWAASDVASDADNAWDDPAVVDAHVHAGWTYDYFARAHGYAGVDGNNGRVVGLVNTPSPTSFFIRPPFGPEGRGAYVFGDTAAGTPLVAQDLVAHELMHGVTYFAVNGRTGSTHSLLDSLTIRRTDLQRLVYAGQTHTCDTLRFRYADGVELPPICENGRFVLFANQGRAVNEAFSDIFATAVEFVQHPPGDGPLTADYLIGEDVPNGLLRSLANPGSRRIGGTSIRYPDAAAGALAFLIGSDGGVARWIPLAFVNGQFVGALPSTDVGGAHWNSTILSHAFHLAIEGGRNATTGRSVTGGGRQTAAAVEQVYFRAMTELMPAYPDFAIAAAVIRQAAVDLFGAGSGVHTAVHQALRAVGL